MATQLHKIVAGPSLMEFMLAMFDGDMGDRKIEFITETTFKHGSKPHPKVNNHIPVVLLGVERESGGDENWNFKGYAFFGTSASEKITGYYNTRRREGHIDGLTDSWMRS